MKKTITIVLFALLCTFSISVRAQHRNPDNYRSPDKNGINVFESPKDTVSTFDGVRVRIGGSSTLQFQALDHSNNGNVALKEIGDNFNLATANLDLDVALFDGVRMHLRTYLSSRHHPEPYVKGGYFQIDRLDFINPGFLEDVMKYVTVKIGHMESNYGDAHFRRSDNAQAIYNPFVGNYIMDAFTTEVGAEVYYRRDGFISMLGVTNGKLNQAVDNPEKTSPSFLAKLGYDKQVQDDLRLRLTGSLYHTAHSSRTYLYGGDRAGSRYYFVMENEEATSKGNFTSGRYDPGLNSELTAVMINPFVKYNGLEFFGMYERSSGKAPGEADTRVWNQYGAELLYRFGGSEKFYVGGRYNLVSGEETVTYNDVDITRYQLGAGWFMTKNILAKLEYVNQTYDGFDTTSILNDGKFNGLMVEAVISF
ncbi:porin family protein [Sinomicrobium kalidii]|uniref:porin family protein n=1 Tax=Sinomicrobium kalidii TaxID=2900738 RepID=UPI001E5952B2|nr:porin family protein [Sinomicrobium kalidii]UGU14658.1 porin family protein [Sinomicrobium kalidii]